ncbi:urease accessory protein UreF [Beijerinckia sp. L45]|uniref:urease accessory protein UreF n=1 Tax=Beijerinckia sp. L45 TaxID=1641855 RepID=UPI00131C24F7|nr:urease accessory UreF family protein [Beijerinckia sp. L45]
MPPRALNQFLALQHADSSFPSGGFAFSNGIEGLAALGALSEGALARIILGALRHRWAGADRIALMAAFRAGGDIAVLARIDAAIEAATLAESLRLGSRRHGQSFLAAHVRLATPGADALRDAVRSGTMLGHVTALQGALWRALGMSEADAVVISGYQAVASLTTAAVRLGQIGAIEAQRVMAQVLPHLADLTDDNPDAAIAAVTNADPVLISFIPFIEIAAARHAHADLHLFSN